MRAYELHPNPGLDALVAAERPSRALAPQEVRVRVRAVSLNFRDLAIARRAAATPGAPRVIPASDGAGEVVETGAAVTRHSRGARVVACFFPTWLDGRLTDAAHAAALGGTADGMLAEEVVLHEDALLSVPEHLSYEEAATLPCAGVTAWHALFEATTTRPGDRVLVQGSGGVSVFALQLARAAGATVVATSSGAAKRARLAELGAGLVLDYRADPQWGETVWQATGGVDAVVEVGGPGTLDQSVLAARYGGAVSLIGVLTGLDGPVATYQILRKCVRVVGIYVGSRAMFERFNAALVASRIHPIIDRVFPFEQARAAYEHLASGAHFGKVVIAGAR